MRCNHSVCSGLYAWALATLVAAAGFLRAGPIETPHGGEIRQVSFERHVMGLLSRLGCNSGSCHGSFQGKGGFYLSLFGYSPEKDHASITREAFGRRISLADPDRSLILLKATGQVSHGGGARFALGSYPHQILREWITQGARWEAGSGEISRLTVEPEELLLREAGVKSQLRVLATFQDGSQSDVTDFSTFRINDDYVARVSETGAVEAWHPGDAAVIVSYRGVVTTSRVLIPAPRVPGLSFPRISPASFIDEEVFSKLRKLNIIPSEPASDTEFLRRVTIDTIGALPTPEEVRAFLADRRADKRQRKIKELLAHPMHAALWATRLCDITNNNVDVMENPASLRSKRSKMWHDWLRHRIEKNVPYDELVRGILCATSLEGDSLAEWGNKELRLLQVAAKGFDTDYARRDTLDLFWRRNSFTVQEMAEQTAVAFLGVRIECAQCHKHPFDRWTMADYRAYANLFAQVTFGIDPESRARLSQLDREAQKKVRGARIRQVYLNFKRPRALRHPDTNDQLDPRPLGGESLDLEKLGKEKKDAREELMKWLTRKDNPYFAHSFVNRVWAHYFGIGLVDPVDDFSMANPPSNPRLLDRLAEHFIASGYDIRKLEELVLSSRAYQLSAIPNASNIHDRRSYSRAYARRMMAEVMVDVLNGALGVTEDFGRDVPKGIRAIEVAPNRVQSSTLNYVFNIFGRPSRTASCDCERPAEPALPQTLYLMTDTNLLGKIKDGRLKKLLAEKKSDEAVVEEMFLAALARRPTAEEVRHALACVQSKESRLEGFVDVVWALINTREFVLNH